MWPLTSTAHQCSFKNEYSIDSNLLIIDLFIVDLEELEYQLLNNNAGRHCNYWFWSNWTGSGGENTSAQQQEITGVIKEENKI